MTCRTHDGAAGCAVYLVVSGRLASFQTNSRAHLRQEHVELMRLLSATYEMARRVERRQAETRELSREIATRYCKVPNADFRYQD